MNPRLAAAFLLGLAAWCAADTAPPPDQIDAAFDGARLKDDLRGSVSDAAKQTRIRLYAAAGARLSLTLTSTAAEGTAIPGMTLALCDDAGSDLGVAGSAYDKSVAGSGVISWRKFPLTATGGYSLVLRGTGTGDWRLTLAGASAGIRETFPSPAPLGVNAEATVDFHGLRGATLSYSFGPAAKSKFKGELVRIERPDASPIDGLGSAAKGKITLDADGVHHVVFRNVGNGIGAWTAKTTVTPAPLLVRRGWVRPSGTAFVPSVRKVTPSSGYKRDQAALVTLTGRDFQPGADVRLVRKGFATDILGKDVTVVSETRIDCTFDLDTGLTVGTDSTGTWNVGVWNAPVYGDVADRTTLVKDSPTSDTRKTFESVTAASIHLPAGVVKATELWQLDFNADFADDLARMGLGSADAEVARDARTTVQQYVVCFLRDLFDINETSGKLKSTSVPVSFVLGTVPGVAGKAGVDYNRIEIGGAYVTGDAADPAEQLAWGFAPLDAGNAHRDDLSIEVDNGSGGKTRVGHGVRTRFLDPTLGTADSDWVTATQTLRQTPLTANDRRYFSTTYSPLSQSDVNRYRDVVGQITRISREIAAAVAHQVGRAMGLSAGGQGPMANPSTAGVLWPTTTSLAFSNADLATLRGNAVAHQLPGTGPAFTPTYFPLRSTQAAVLPDLTTDVAYSVDWNYVGGRPNAVPADYAVKFSGGTRPLDLAVTYKGLAGKARLYLDASTGSFYCDLAIFRITVTDSLRGGAVSFVYRLNVLANVPKLRPGVEQTNAQNCNNAILSTP